MISAHKSQNRNNSDVRVDFDEGFSDNEDSFEDRYQSIHQTQKEIFDAICNESLGQLKSIFETHNPSLILQVLVTFTYPNHDGLFKHDSEILMDAAELLGPSVLNLNAIQVACFLGEEEIAVAIIDYVAFQSQIMSAKKVLYEFLSKVWGMGNTTLHIASFMGMSSLVKRLIDLGANTNKRNERNYKAVDCADDDKTRTLFLSIKEVIRYPIRRSMSVDGVVVRKKENHYFEAFFTNQERTPTLQRTKAIHQKNYPEKLSKRASRDDVKPKVLLTVEEVPDPTNLFNVLSPLSLARAKSLGSTTPTSSGSLSPDEDTEKVEPVNTIYSTTDCLESFRKPRRHVTFDPRTLALDCARNGDFIQLKYTLENPLYSQALKFDGGLTVYDVTSPQSRLTLIHLAASYNHLPICQYLIDRGCDVNARDKEGWTPIHCAAAEGHEPVVRYLLTLDYLAVDALTIDDESPCDVATTDSIRALLKGKRQFLVTYLSYIDKLVRRLSSDKYHVGIAHLEASRGNLQKATATATSNPTKLAGKVGGDAAFLRPARSLSQHRGSTPFKPFSPPHSFTKPLDESISPIIAHFEAKNNSAPSTKQGYSPHSLASF